MLLLVTLGLVLLAACGPKVTPVAGQIPIATPVLPTPMEERAAPPSAPGWSP